MACPEKVSLKAALIWIMLYMVLFSIADNMSKALGIEKIVTAPFAILFAALLFIWMNKKGLKKEYGLCAFQGKGKQYLYFIPLALIASVNLWRGVSFRFPPAETVLYIWSMVGVGFIEEFLFRGFLFKALRKEGIKRAVLISSLTFGIGHMVNLLNGADMISTLLQVIYACTVGFLFTVIFYKGKSLIPCIASHSLLNASSRGDSACRCAHFHPFGSGFTGIYSVDYPAAALCSF